MSSEPKPATKPPRRFWPRFTLRVLLVVVTLLCIGLGWWTHRARGQRRVVERIRSTGGYVIYDYEFGQPRGKAVSPIPDSLLRVAGADFFHRAIHARIESRDALQNVSKLPALDELEVAISGISDDDVRAVTQIPTLKYLLLLSPFGETPLLSSQISDRSLCEIGKMRRLMLIDVMTGKISSTGLAALAKAPNLREIRLTCPNNGLEGDPVAVLTASQQVQSVLVEAYEDDDGSRSFCNVLDWQRPEK